MKHTKFAIILIKAKTRIKKAMGSEKSRGLFKNFLMIIQKLKSRKMIVKSSSLQFHTVIKFFVKFYENINDEYKKKTSKNRKYLPSYL